MAATGIAGLVGAIAGLIALLRPNRRRHGHFNDALEAELDRALERAHEAEERGERAEMECERERAERVHLQEVLDECQADRIELLKHRPDHGSS